MSIIKIDNVSFKYQEETPYVIDGLSLTVEKGEFICVLGKNGSGKSTLAKLLNGMLLPTSGDISVFDMDVKDKNSIFDIRKKVGVVFQNPDNQMVATIVEDDIAFGPENIGLPREEIGERIDFALTSTGMQNYRQSMGQRLSGGQKQRVAIAGVLAIKPDVLILDESTSMLDAKGRKEVMDVVKKLNQENGVTVISITHYMEEVIQADRVIVLSDGKIALSGTPEEIFNQKDKLNELGLELPVPARIKEKLEKNGVEISGNPLDESALGEQLCKLASKI